MLMYIINVLLLCSLCVAWLGEISQPVSFQTAKLGDSATIECYIKGTGRRKVWYKLTTWNRLQLVAEMDSLYNRIVTAQHYSVKSDSINSHLVISATVWEDVGTFFCGVMNLNSIKFGSGTFLMLKGANIISNSVIQQPQYELVHPGASVNLSCSIRSNHCPAEQISVVWFKNTNHSAADIIYSSDNNSNNRCQRSEAKTTCVFNLVVRNLSSDDGGTYYCAATSCGQVEFGNGTKIMIAQSASIGLNQTFIALLLSNIILGLVTLILAWALCMSWREKATETSGSHEENQATDTVVYAAVCSLSGSFHPRQDAVDQNGDAVVYSKIRDFQQHVELSL